MTANPLDQRIEQLKDTLLVSLRLGVNAPSSVWDEYKALLKLRNQGRDTNLSNRQIKYLTWRAAEAMKEKK
jgi:hypothetical protein